MPVTECRRELSHLAGQRLDTDRQQERQRENDGRVPEGEPEPDRQRLALRGAAARVPGGIVGKQLAGRVVHGGDVVGVEGVPQPEGVGQHAHPDVEDRVIAAEVVMLRRDQAEQDAESDHVQQHDEPGHAGQ
jgi:hypothetical protein